MEEIVEAVMYEIDKSGYADRLQAGIVITGGGSGLSGLASYIKQKSGYDTRIASPDKNVTFVAAEGCCKPSSSTAVGLIIKGFEYEENNSVILSIPSIRGELFPTPEEVAIEAEPEVAPKTKGKEKEKIKSEKGPKTKGIFSTIPNIFGDMFNTTNDEA
ncbi:Cell division protein FtsA [bioreactor metagenome]|uniref:Cell division protein FtsA n=1 Tax=bioreactor metagenome TaxID=1076179 RepID=A0A645I1A8_9ZZZZ